MTVSEDLEKYRPMTIWQIIGMIWEMASLYVAAALTGLLFSVAAAMFRTRLVEGGIVMCLVSGTVVVNLISTLLKYRPPVSEALKEYCERKAGYWMIYYTRDDFVYIHSSGPMTSSAFHERYKTLKSEEGFHVCLPLKDGERGYAVIGRACTTQDQNKQLRDWRFLPLHVTYGVLGCNVFVRLEDPAGSASLNLPLIAAINFLVKSPVGWLARNSLVGVIDSMIGINADFKKKLGETEQKLAKATDTLVEVATVTKHTQRFFSSKGGKGIREKATAMLCELLPATDPRLLALGVSVAPPVAPPAAEPPKKSVADNDHGCCACGPP